MKLPQRPGPYIMTLLLLLLIALVFYMSQAIDSPQLQRAIERAKASKSAPTESAH